MTYRITGYPMTLIETEGHFCCFEPL